MFVFAFFGQSLAVFNDRNNFEACCLMQCLYMCYVVQVVVVVIVTTHIVKL